ncbi:hypothetical protein GCM10009564_39750 [Streptomyces thermogriseus]|uniref:Uncharacterized protein n=1 Tax=Streptomyces thermogriseus TaxID=75292 RepID=A0ABP4DKX3_9ACTN
MRGELPTQPGHGGAQLRHPGILTTAGHRPLPQAPQHSPSSPWHFLVHSSGRISKRHPERDTPPWRPKFSPKSTVRPVVRRVAPVWSFEQAAQSFGWARRFFGWARRSFG